MEDEIYLSWLIHLNHLYKFSVIPLDVEIYGCDVGILFKEDNKIRCLGCNLTSCDKMKYQEILDFKEINVKTYPEAFNTFEEVKNYLLEKRIDILLKSL